MRSHKTLTGCILIAIFAIILSNTKLCAQHGGIGVKFTQQNYDFSEHPDYKKFINSLYISVKLSKHLTLFIDSYLYSTDGAGFESGTVENKISIEKSCFSDRATVLGPMYFQKLPIYNLYVYGGAGFGWHSLKIGDNDDNNSKETSKNYAAHLVIGVSHDIIRLPAIIFFEMRKAYVFLNDDSGASQYNPTALHRSGTLNMTGISFGLLIYFF